MSSAVLTSTLLIIKLGINSATDSLISLSIFVLVAVSNGSKIYFIKLFEREAILIMSELLREEVNRFSQILNDGLTDKPYYRDLYKSEGYRL